MPDDAPPSATLTATLSAIREDIEAIVAVYDLDGAGKNSYPVSAAMSRHVLRFLAALEAVLKLADDAVPQIYAPGKPLYWSVSPDDIREAITAELTGTGRAQPGEDGNHG